jgi:predicted O-methyltransferase YrrM
MTTLYRVITIPLPWRQGPWRDSRAEAEADAIRLDLAYRDKDGSLWHNALIEFEAFEAVEAPPAQRLTPPEPAQSDPAQHIRQFMRRIRNSPVGRIANIPRRLIQAAPIAAAPLVKVPGWLIASREDTNYTYPLSARNLRHLGHTVSAVTGVPVAEVLNYIHEAVRDEALTEHVINHAASGPDRNRADRRCDFAKRLAWYAVARITKPEVIIETGVDKGLGSILLASALLRNGHGRLYGTDIKADAGSLISGRYAKVAEVLYGDSIRSLQAFDRPIDLFINDSDHSAAYEAAEYEVIAPKLSPGAIVLADNAHSTDALMDWSERKGRRFLFWSEKPEDHWYPGGGTGFSF